MPDLAVSRHGHAGRVEAPDDFVAVLARGPALRLDGRPNAVTWVHFALPTPTVSSIRRVQLGAVWTRLRAFGGSTIEEVQAYHGRRLLGAVASLAWRGLGLGSAAFDFGIAALAPEVVLTEALGISLRLRFDEAGSRIEIAAVGCDLKSAPKLCAEKFFVQQWSGEYFLPLASRLDGSDQALHKPSTAVRRALICFHGNGSDAWKYVEAGHAATQAAEGIGTLSGGTCEAPLTNLPIPFSPPLDADALATTLIVAPQFLMEDELGPFPPGDILYFGGGRFFGGPSGTSVDHPRPFVITSFEVIDLLLGHLTDSGLFPNLEQIVLVGQSGGGQLVNRYAACGVFERPGVHLCYVVMNPGSYLYHDGRRARRDGDAVEWPPTFEYPNVPDCPQYDDYGFGLSNLVYPYQLLHAQEANGIRQRYREREVRYLVGACDNDPDHPALPRHCSAQLQGAHRLERAKVYFAHLKDVHGTGITDQQSLNTVPGVSHDGRATMLSAVGLPYLFPPTTRNCKVFPLLGNGKLGNLVFERHLEPGAVLAEPFGVQGAPYFLVLWESGTARVFPVNANASMGASVASENWGTGWTSVASYTSGAKTFLVRLRKSDGELSIHRMENDGSFGEETDSRHIKMGCTAMRTFATQTGVFLFRVFAGTGEVRINRLDADGTLGKFVKSETWSKGWTHALFFTLLQPFPNLLILKEGGLGDLHVHRMEADGTVGPKMFDGSIGPGWSHALAFPMAPYWGLLRVNGGTGELRINQLKPAYAVSTHQANLEPGWGVVSSFAASGNQFLVLIRDP